MKNLLSDANNEFSKKNFSRALEIYKHALIKSKFKSNIEFFINLCESKISTESQSLNQRGNSLILNERTTIVIFSNNNSSIYTYYEYEFLDKIKNSEEKGFYGWLNNGQCNASEYKDFISTNQNKCAFILFKNIDNISPFFYEITTLIEHIITHNISHLHLNSNEITCNNSKPITSYIEFTNTIPSTKDTNQNIKQDIFQNSQTYSTIHSLKRKIKQFKSNKNQNSYSEILTRPTNWSTDDFINNCLVDAHVLNLEHRLDRRENTEKQFSLMGIKPTFVKAIHGLNSEKCKKLLEKDNDFIDEFIKHKKFTFKYQSEMYTSYSCEENRLQNYYHTQGKIMSLGSIAYMLSYKKALIQACMSNKHSNYCSVFDDDILLHKDWPHIIESLLKTLPDNFTILSLGSIQYNWQPEIVNMFSDTLYQCFGTSLASHATVYRKDIARKIINIIDEMQLPFDIGALHYFKKTHFDSSFTIFPNLFIQDSSESDIADTVNQLNIGTKIDNIYRWHLPSYNHG